MNRLSRHFAASKTIKTPQLHPQLTDDPQSARPAGPRSVCLNFNKLRVEERTSNLARVVSTNTLPVTIHLAKDFTIKNSPVAFQSGELLLLCFVLDVERVHVTMGKNTYELPLHANQLYEKLPLDPRLDDKIYRGTRALIEAKPRPAQVRIVDAQLFPDQMASQSSGDVITIQTVDVQNHPERGKERVLVGIDEQGAEVRFPEAMDMATYSTMIADHLPLSELLKYDMPQRLRLLDTDNTDAGKISKDGILMLHHHYTDYHVITARARDNTLLSIPLSSSFEFHLVETTFREVRSLLPAVFNRVNATWDVVDITQPRLPAEMRPIPKPIPDVFQEWAKSHEGKEVTGSIIRQEQKKLKNIIMSRDVQISTLKNVARQASETPRPPVPPRSDRPLSTDVANKLETAQQTIKELRKEIKQKDIRIIELLNTEKECGHELVALRRERDGFMSSQQADRAEIGRLQSRLDQMQRYGSDGVYEDLEGDGYCNPLSLAKSVSPKMTTADTVDLLRHIGLSEYCDIFYKEDIDGLMLLAINEEMMVEDLKMRKLDARRLTAHISRQSESSS
ncbi:uncharacterized protein [Diadema antillarum]|uniref:uncharacterized protein n=1 Tax=Diadema antillarum TaxID=105358 RepID=UPI003A83ABAC